MGEIGVKNRKRVYGLIAIILVLCICLTVFVYLGLNSNVPFQDLNSDAQPEVSTSQNQTTDVNANNSRIIQALLQLHQVRKTTPY